MLQAERADDCVIATGKSYSLRDFVRTAFAAVGLDWQRHLAMDPALARRTDITYSSGDASKAEQLLGWRARSSMPQVVQMMTAELRARRQGAAGAAGAAASATSATTSS